VVPDIYTHFGLGTKKNTWFSLSGILLELYAPMRGFKKGIYFVKGMLVVCL
jgi:hypothetical protein